jgi:hypothetical protein
MPEMKDIHHKMFTFEEKVIDAEEGIIEHVISAHMVDTDREVVWLPTYKVSPNVAVLMDHGYNMIRGIKPIGGNLSIKLIGGALDAKLVVQTKFIMYDEEAKLLFRMHQDGFIKGWSIGYRVGEYLFDADARKFLIDNGWPEADVLDVRAVHNNIYIKEYSSTAIPANEGAVDIRNQVSELVAKSESYNNLTKELEMIRTDIEALKEGHTLKGRISSVLFPSSKE